MKAESVKALLTLLNSKQTGTRGKWIQGRCILGPWRHDGEDKHPSFAISAEPGQKSICKCLSCGFGGDLQDALIEIRRYMRQGVVPGYDMVTATALVNNELEEIEIDVDGIPEYGATKNKVDLPFPEDWLESFAPIQMFDEAMSYVTARGISHEALTALDTRFDPKKRRIGFPFRNKAGVLMGMQGRAIDDSNSLRYFQYGYKGKRNSQCWMREDKIDFDYPVVITEGPFDVAKIFDIYENVMASFTTGLSMEKVLRAADAGTIITFYDYGKGGNAARNTIRKYLSGSTIVDILITEQDGDAGAMGLQELYDLIEPHVYK